MRGYLTEIELRRYARKWSWFNLRYCPGICQEGLSKINEGLVMIARPPGGD
jgi:hypothetical protein